MFWARYSDLFKFAFNVAAGLSVLLSTSSGSADEEITSTWSRTFQLPSISISISPESFQPPYKNPVYVMMLPNGDRIDLPLRHPVDLRGFSEEEIRELSEDSRIMIEGFMRLILSGRNPTAAVVNQNLAIVLTPNVDVLKSRGLVSVDPIAAALLEDRPIGEVTQNQSSRIQQFGQFVADNVFYSTARFGRENWNAHKSVSGRVAEIGIQIAFRGELQLGMGETNFTRNYPWMFSLGYNRVSRTIVFRRGFRTEKMSGGTALSDAGKIEFRIYRLALDSPDVANQGQYSWRKIGKTWNPPTPFSSLAGAVFDSGAGYHSAGFVIGINLHNIIAPWTLLIDAPIAYMNTETMIEETQHVYNSAPLPSLRAWMDRIRDRWNGRLHQLKRKKVKLFGGRCEALFVSVAP